MKVVVFILGLVMGVFASDLLPKPRSEAAGLNGISARLEHCEAMLWFYKSRPPHTPPQGD